MVLIYILGSGATVNQLMETKMVSPSRSLDLSSNANGGSDFGGLSSEGKQRRSSAFLPLPDASSQAADEDLVAGGCPGQSNPFNGNQFLLTSLSEEGLGVQRTSSNDNGLLNSHGVMLVGHHHVNPPGWSQTPHVGISSAYTATRRPSAFYHPGVQGNNLMNTAIMEEDSERSTDEVSIHKRGLDEMSIHKRVHYP